MKPIQKLVLLSLGTLTLTALPSKAQLIITEVMSQEQSTDVYGQDWFELTNYGSSAISTTGLYMSDASGVSAETALRLTSGSIGASQSVIFIDDPSGASNDATLNAQFETSWFGSNVPSGFQIGDYTQVVGEGGVAFSSSGDSANVYNGTTASSKIAGVSFGTATRGVSFDNSVAKSTATGTTTDPTISTLSQVGKNGAFQTSSTEIGSPGAVPEPRTWALIISGFAMLIGYTLRRQTPL